MTMARKYLKRAPRHWGILRAVAPGLLWVEIRDLVPPPWRGLIGAWIGACGQGLGTKFLSEWLRPCRRPGVRLRSKTYCLPCHGDEAGTGLEGLDLWWRVEVAGWHTRGAVFGLRLHVLVWKMITKSLHYPGHCWKASERSWRSPLKEPTDRGGICT